MKLSYKNIEDQSRTKRDETVKGKVNNKDTQQKNHNNSNKITLIIHKLELEQRVDLCYVSDIDTTP